MKVTKTDINNNYLKRAWNLTDKELEFLTGKLFNSRDFYTRSIALASIYYYLHILLPTKSANAWVRRKNLAPLFNGKSALEYMLIGKTENIINVKEYLASQIYGP